MSLEVTCLPTLLGDVFGEQTYEKEPAVKWLPLNLRRERRLCAHCMLTRYCVEQMGTEILQFGVRIKRRVG